MSNQELLTYLFNAIALGFLFIAAMDFTTRSAAVYNQIKVASNSPSTNVEKPVIQTPLATIEQALPQLPDPWLLPLPVEESVVLVKSFQKEQKHLWLLPQAKASAVASSELEDSLQGVDLDKLKIRQARKIAKMLGIAQKVNGKDQKLAFLVSQIKLKLQQAKVEILEVVQQELVAC